MTFFHLENQLYLLTGKFKGVRQLVCESRLKLSNFPYPGDRLSEKIIQVD